MNFFEYSSSNKILKAQPGALIPLSGSNRYTPPLRKPDPAPDYGAPEGAILDRHGFNVWFRLGEDGNLYTAPTSFFDNNYRANRERILDPQNPNDIVMYRRGMESLGYTRIPNTNRYLISAKRQVLPTETASLASEESDIATSTDPRLTQSTAREKAEIPVENAETSVQSSSKSGRAATNNHGIFSGDLRSYQSRKKWVQEHLDYLKEKNKNVDWNNYSGTSEQNLALKGLVGGYDAWKELLGKRTNTRKDIYDQTTASAPYALINPIIAVQKFGGKISYIDYLK